MARREDWIKNKKHNFENNISDIIYGTVKPLINNYSKLEADLILNWNKIFDSKLRGRISLDKVIFTDKKNNKFILHINVNNKDFLEITHSTPVIIEQLSIYLGYNGVERIKIHKL